MDKIKASESGKAHFVVSNLAKDGLLTTYCGCKCKANAIQKESKQLIQTKLKGDEQNAN